MNSLVEMRHNGTVRSFVRLPFTEGTLCVTLAVGRRSVTFYIIAGVQGFGMSLGWSGQSVPDIFLVIEGIRIRAILNNCQESVQALGSQRLDSVGRH